jgi:cytochrome P450
MTAASRQGARDVPLMPGGRRFLGHALRFGRDPLALFQEARDHGDVVRVQFGPFGVYILNSPDVIRQALVGEARKLGKGLNFGRPRRLIGNGLVMSEGESHDRQRRLMQPAFHRTQVARYVSTMRDVAVPRISGWPDGGTLAFDREMRSITLTVLTRTLLSSDIGADVIDEIERLLRVLLSELVARGITANVPGLAWVPTRSNRRFGAASRRLDVLLAGIIDGYRRAEADRSGLISLLMHARDDDTGAGMTDKQLRDEATTLVIAGSETTGNTIAWACYLLARHPHLQERLQEEADLVLDGADADYETLGRLPFTRAVITEALRLYSPVWILPRRALADVELGGCLLRAGSRIFFSPYALNRDARLHRDPDRFDPDRWATDYSRSDMRAMFFPFGQGIRNCIGEGFAWAESTLLLSAIAARWQLRLAAGAAVHPVISSTLVPSELPITVTRRR